MESWMIPAAGSMLVLLACALLGWTLYRRHRSRALRNHFGPEYDASILKMGSRSRAESDLKGRLQRMRTLEIRLLSGQEVDRFLETWRGIQRLFMDSPIAAVAEAELFVKEVMRTRGYPMGDFDRRAADISVDHPEVVSRYRSARAIALQSKTGPASTEELRQAMVHYRALVESLLESSENLVTEPVPTH